MTGRARRLLLSLCSLALCSLAIGPSAVVSPVSARTPAPADAADAQAPTAGCDGAAVTEVAPGVFLRPGRHAPVFEEDDLANVGFVIGERGVAVIDTGGSPAEGAALRCAIAERTDLPVTHVINTHVHPDHTLGNRAFADAPGVVFVGHARLPRALGLRGPHYVMRANEIRGAHWDAAAVIVPPDVTVAESLDIDLGGRTLTLTAWPSAHTDNDLTVTDSASGAFWAGDLLFLEHIPVIDASINGWIDILEQWLEMPAPALVIPGHGPAGTLWEQAVARNLGYLRAVRADTREAIRAGQDLAAAQAGVARAAAEGWLLAEEYHRRNIATAYVELEWE